MRSKVDGNETPTRRSTVRVGKNRLEAKRKTGKERRKNRGQASWTVILTCVGLGNGSQGGRDKQVTIHPHPGLGEKLMEQE